MRVRSITRRNSASTKIQLTFVLVKIFHQDLYRSKITTISYILLPLWIGIYAQARVRMTTNIHKQDEKIFHEEY